MRFGPVIKGKMEQFRTNYGYEKATEDVAFERFINYSIIENHHPEAVLKDQSLLEIVSAGGPNDMGIDGIAIKVNNKFITSEQEIENLVELRRKLNIEFLFIQSKKKETIDTGEYAKFLNGVLDFLSETHNEPHNEKIDDLLTLKDRLFENDMLQYYDESPRISLYYVYLGEWNDNEHMIAKTNNFKVQIKYLKQYDEPIVNYIDEEGVRDICKRNEKKFSWVLPFIDSFGLNEVEGIQNSLVVLCSADDIVEMISDENRQIRKSLFADNVRDFQGETTLNNHILQTIEDFPGTFSLMNNGITIVCNNIVQQNRRVSLSDPQVVNGCQTCHIIHQAFIAGKSLKKVTLLAKIISTESDNLINAIVKATNSQNIVPIEAFETVKEFHKKLEEFFEYSQNKTPQDKRIYYERRSNQFLHNHSILPVQIVKVEVLLPSFVSMFLEAPQDSKKFIGTLIENYQGRVFVEHHSFQPYFLSSSLLLRIERFVREGLIEKQALKYKYHILLLLGRLILGKPPSMNNRKQVDDYCLKINEGLIEDETILSFIERSQEIIKEANAFWISQKGESSIHRTVDNPKFTRLIIDIADNGKTPAITLEEDSQKDIEYYGVVVKVAQDRNGFFYGFIRKSTDAKDDVFFHQEYNQGLDYENLWGKNVLFTTFVDRRNGRTRGKIFTVQN